MTTTSISLLHRLKDPDDRVAWCRFVDLYSPLIYHWGVKSGLTSEDAADLVQDILTLIARLIEGFQYQPGDRFRAWLKTVTRHRINDLHRRNRVRRTSPMEVAYEPITYETADQVFCDQEANAILARDAIAIIRAEFSPVSWRAFHACVVEQKPAADIAKECGISVNSVYLAKSRILARLRQEFDGLLD